MAKLFGQLDSLMCARRDDVADCEVMLRDGRVESVEASEVEVDGDADVLNSFSIGEVHVDPNDELFVGEINGKVVVKDRQTLMEEETGLEVRQR